MKVQTKMNFIPFLGPWQYASDFLAPCYALSCNIMSVVFFKIFIRTRFSSFLPEYDSWGPGLDAMKLPGNRGAFAR